MIMVKIEKRKVEYDVDLEQEVRVSLRSRLSDCSYSPDVSRLSGLLRRKSGPTRRSNKGGWREDEDTLLAELVEKYSGKNWKQIASYLPGRTDTQCLHRWQKVLNPQLIKGPWTKEEDNHIIELVEKCGCRKWSVIAKSLPGRIGKQCRERWYNHLDPTIKKDAWTEEEEFLIAKYHQLYGNKWAEIARFLPGRSDNAIKNHWNCSLKKRLHSHSPSGSAIDMRQTTSPDFCICGCKPECIMVKAEEQSDQTVYINQNVGLEDSVDTSSTDFVYGNVNAGENHLKTKSVEVRHCGSSGEMNNLKSLLTSQSCRDIMNHTYIHDKVLAAPKRPRDNGIDEHLGFGNEKQNHAGEKNKATRISLLTDIDHRCCNYETAEMKDLTVAAKYLGSPAMDNDMESPFCYSTPPNLSPANSVKSISPESILRKSAMSFKNTPSIIRKKTFRKSEDAVSPPWTISSTRSKEIKDNADFLKVKQGFLSSHQKPEASAAIKSLERCLELVFDMEHDAAPVKCGSSVSASASPDLRFGATSMLIP